MEGDEITIVLVRASELRSKITNCIDKATKRDSRTEDETGDENGPDSVEDGDDGEVENEAESLLSIRDALESLEEQLSSLQVLQQQQRYEREATLAEIDHSRKILLKKIEEYKGEDLEVIHEASSFASETVEHNDDLLLPPYPSHPTRPLILENGYSSSFLSGRSFSRNGVTNNGAVIHPKKSASDTKEQRQNQDQNSQSGFRLVISVAAKTMLTLVSVVSILSLAGFETKLGRRSTHFNVMNFFQKPTGDERPTIQCPPGKVLVFENGEPRCLVKERVEIPFESVVTTPNVSYGCG